MIEHLITFPGRNYRLAGVFTRGRPMFTKGCEYRAMIALLFEYAVKLNIIIVAWSLEDYRIQLTLKINGSVNSCGLLKRAAAQYCIQFEQPEIMSDLHFFERKINDEQALVKACRYVHCAPVMDNRCLHPDEWSYSNMLEFTRVDFWKKQPPLLRRLFSYGKRYSVSLNCHMNSRRNYPVNIRFERINPVIVEHTPTQPSFYPKKTAKHCMYVPKLRRKIQINTVAERKPPQPDKSAEKKRNNSG